MNAENIGIDLSAYIAKATKNDILLGQRISGTMATIYPRGWESNWFDMTYIDHTPSHDKVIEFSQLWFALSPVEAEQKHTGGGGLTILNVGSRG